LENQEIARVLWETADLMEIAGEDSFRIRSYRNGATAVEGIPSASPISCATRSALSLRSPESARAGARSGGDCGARLLRTARPAVAEVPSYGPRIPQDSGAGSQEHRAHFEHYRISTIDELERLCHEQKLRVLPRMGAKLEEKVLRSIAQYRQRSGRYLLSYAEAVAAELIEALGQVPGVDAITPGSLRRGRETVGDLDLLSPAPRPRRARALCEVPRVEECWAAARTRPAPEWAAKVCRWMCARWRQRISAPRCNTHRQQGP